MWKYWNPVNIYFSNNFINNITEIVGSNKKILIICSERFKLTKEYQLIKNQIKSFQLFTDIEHNPSFESCNLAIDSCIDINPDIIISIGGGSILDTAKIARLALNSKTNSVREMLSGDFDVYKKTKLICIPTTHGTASELTKWATVWNKKERKKYSISNDSNYPNFAIYDYHFLDTLPLQISLVTTLDALSHSFEALWNKNSNPISDNYAIEAIKIIIENIGNLNKETDKNTRINLLKSTMYSGLAFSNTKTAAAHSISYPLTAKFNIPHGIACSITLKSILYIYYSNVKSKIDKLLNELEITNVNELWITVENFVRRHIKFSLSEFGINESQLTEIVDASFTKGRMDNFIIQLNEQDVLKILIENFNKD